MILYNDSQSAQKWSINPVYHKRSKHIDVKYDSIKDMISNGIIKLEYLPTGEIPADILTKSLGTTQHFKLMTSLSIVK